ncbi:MAG: carbohydrate kinase [Clostridiales bacterium]|jgi:fructokinase|nr:carbohydrate kinase [Clostridiales bacterium]
MIMRTFDCVTVSDSLIDLVRIGNSEQGNPVYEANPGGAPVNVLAMLSRLGHKTAFNGKVGDDAFGRQIVSALNEMSIDTANVIFDKEHHTTLALVAKLPNGDRDFSFIFGADKFFVKEDVNDKLLSDTRALHFCTISMAQNPSRETTRYAVELAKKLDALISFDPNLRPPLWNSLDEAKVEIGWGISQCDILKISDNEIEWFTGEKDFDKAVEIIREKYNIPLICVTMGKAGSRAYYADKIVSAETFLSYKPVETTGAGDCFCGCMLHYVLERGLDSLSEKQLYEMLRFANAGATLVTQKKGALRVMPTKAEIEGLLTPMS